MSSHLMFDPKEINQSVINNDKVLSKLCYAVIGRPIEERHFELMTDMYRYLSSMEKKPITRQAIRLWFKTDGKPSRTSAFVFLSSYLESKRIEFGDSKDISSERRKVIRQLGKFFRDSISSGKSRAVDAEISEDIIQSNKIAVSIPSSGRISIEIPDYHEDSLDEYRDLVGIYELYRTRMVFSGEKFIAKEVIRIFGSGKKLYFRQWFLFQGSEMSRFDGVVSIIGSSIWLIGASHRNENRLRVIKFRHGKSPSSTSSKIRWGIMLTEIPQYGGAEPAACKVVLIRPEVVVNDIDAFCRANVRNMSEKDVPERIRNIIIRMIDNNITSSSFPNSTQELKLPDGSTATDSVLRTNQETLDNAIFGLFRT